MDESLPANTFSSIDHTALPFVGRRRTLAWLHQNLTDSAQTHASALIGRRHIGKTALLRQFLAIADESMISVAIPLRPMTFARETEWLLYLIQITSAALTARDYTMTRVANPPAGAGTLRDWLRETYLPEIFRLIRPSRLVWLLDDADRLINAVESGKLPDDSGRYLHELLEQHPFLRIVLTLDTAAEGRIDTLAPPINPTEVLRLTALSREESRHLLQAWIEGLTTLPDDSLGAIYDLTGGQPQLLQRFGDHLFRFIRAQPGTPTIKPDHVKQLIPAIYAESEWEYKLMWNTLSRNERLILTAVGSLAYANPLRGSTADEVEAWLVETDYPLDTITIRATIRSLEYREIVNSASGVKTSAGLMQKWLLENARLGAVEVEPVESRRRVLWVLALVLIVVAGLVAIIIVGNAPGQPTNPALEPTVTLLGQE